MKEVKKYLDGAASVKQQEVNDGEEQKQKDEGKCESDYNDEPMEDEDST